MARFEDASGRNSFVPWLDARLEPAAGGGTTLAGSIGLNPAVRALIPLFAGVWALIAVTAISGGIALLVHGHLGGVPAVLLPFGIAALFAGINVAGLRSLERDIPKLIDEINDILDSTATLAATSLP